MEEWNIQTHLATMEHNIREDIREVGELALAAQKSAEENRRETVSLRGQIIAIENNLGWLYSGVFAGVLALVGYVWQMLTSALKATKP